MSDEFYDSDLSQSDRGVHPRDLAEQDGDENPIPPHCGRCAKTLDNDDRELCPKCEWETDDSAADARTGKRDAPRAAQEASR